MERSIGLRIQTDIWIDYRNEVGAWSSCRHRRMATYIAWPTILHGLIAERGLFFDVEYAHTLISFINILLMDQYPMAFFESGHLPWSLLCSGLPPEVHGPEMTWCHRSASFIQDVSLLKMSSPVGRQEIILHTENLACQLREIPAVISDTSGDTKYRNFWVFGKFLVAPHSIDCWYQVQVWNAWWMDCISKYWVYNLMNRAQRGELDG